MTDLFGFLIQSQGVEERGIRHRLLEVVVGRSLLLCLLLKVPRSFASRKRETSRPIHITVMLLLKVHGNTPSCRILQKSELFASCSRSYSQCCGSTDILVWIRIWIRRSMPLINGSGSGSCYFRHWPSRCRHKTNFFIEFFCLLLFEGTFKQFFEDKNSKRSHKTVGIKVFLTIFAYWKDPDPDPYLWLMDPDPCGPKTYGSDGSGSHRIRNTGNSYSKIVSTRMSRHSVSFIRIIGDSTYQGWTFSKTDLELFWNRYNPRNICFANGAILNKLAWQILWNWILKQVMHTLDLKGCLFLKIYNNVETCMFAYVTKRTLKMVTSNNVVFPNYKSKKLKHQLSFSSVT
jgi:hypothetical protein